MREWNDIVMLVWAVTLANHLGLVEAAEAVIRHKIPVLRCSKCAGFWVVLGYALLAGWSAIASVAVSFLCSYAAVWLELLLGYLDTIYNKIYENLYPAQADGAPDTEGEVSDLRKVEKAKRPAESKKQTRK